MKREKHKTRIIGVQITEKKSEYYTDYIYTINSHPLNENFMKKDTSVTIDTYPSLFFNPFPLWAEEEESMEFNACNCPQFQQSCLPTKSISRTYRPCLL